MVTTAELVRLLEQRYPVELAADWDAVGLVCGDPSASVTKVLFAVDPVMEVVDEALTVQADFIVTHHPLFLRGVHSVAPVDHKGSVVHTLISHGIGLYCAHTNADHANPGVSDALADVLGVIETRPLSPEPDAPQLGTGRVGRLNQPMSLGDFAERVAAVLPVTNSGVRVAGDLSSEVRTVAVCGGSGDSLLQEAARVADVYVTSDLRHHRAQDHRADSSCALVDVPHWAGEWPWLPVAAEALRRDVAAVGSTVEVHVSRIVTDPWTAHLGSSH